MDFEDRGESHGLIGHAHICAGLAYGRQTRAMYEGKTPPVMKLSIAPPCNLPRRKKNSL